MATVKLDCVLWLADCKSIVTVQRLFQNKYGVKNCPTKKRNAGSGRRPRGIKIKKKNIKETFASDPICPQGKQGGSLEYLIPPYVEC